MIAFLSKVEKSDKKIANTIQNNITALELRGGKTMRYIQSVAKDVEKIFLQQND